MNIKFEDIKDQAGLEAAVTKVIAESTGTLTTKNGELLDELKAARKLITPEDEITRLKKIETDFEELKNNKMSGNAEYEKLINNAKTQHETDLQGKNATIDKLNGQLNTTLVSETLIKALSKANVNKDLLKAAATMLTPQVSVIDQNDIRVALVGDQTIPDFVKDWVTTGEGKHFVTAPNNSGGGGDGNGSGDGQGSEQEKYFDPDHKEFNMTKQASLYNTDKAEYTRLAEKYEGVEAGMKKAS